MPIVWKTVSHWRAHDATAAVAEQFMCGAHHFSRNLARFGAPD